MLNAYTKCCGLFYDCSTAKYNYFIYEIINLSCALKLGRYAFIIIIYYINSERERERDRHNLR